MTESQILDNLLQTIITACVGNGSILGFAQSIFGYLITIDFVIAVLFNLLSLGQQEVLSQFIGKLMKYGFWLWLINNWGYIVNVFIDSLSTAGMSLGSMGPEILYRPSAIINMGFGLAGPFFNYLTNFTSWTNIGGSIFVYIVALLGGLGIIIGFFILGFQVFVTFVEFYISSTLMLLFLPFAANKFTSRFAEAALGGVMAHGVKLMFLGAIISITAPVLNGLEIDFSTSPTWESIFSAALAPWSLAFLSWQAPAMAAGFMSGGPSLTASAMARNSATVGSLGAAGAVGGVKTAFTAAKGTAATAAFGYRGAKYLGSKLGGGGASSKDKGLDQGNYK